MIHVVLATPLVVSSPAIESRLLVRLSKSPVQRAQDRLPPSDNDLVPTTLSRLFAFARAFVLLAAGRLRGEVP